MPRPDASFKGCWHCGKPGHSRTKGRGKDRKPDCPEFKALIAKYNGLPKDYEGAYEAWAKKQGLDPQTVHLKALIKPDGDEDGAVDELREAQEEINAIREALQFGCFDQLALADGPSRFSQPTTFSLLDGDSTDGGDADFECGQCEEDEAMVSRKCAPSCKCTPPVQPPQDTDEDLLVQFLGSIAHQVNTGPAKSQAQRKAESREPKVVNSTKGTPKCGIMKQRLTKKQIDKVAAAINRGELQLPDINLECDEDYFTVWALANTGSAAHVADR